MRRSEPIRFPNCDLEISPVPLRRVVTRSSQRIKDKFCSRKMGRMIPAESSNEYACLVRAELDPTVTHVFVQALEFRWRDNLGWHRHWPDVVTVRRGRVEVREVKPDLDAETDRVRATAAFASHYCAERGAVYRLDLESSLKAQPTYANALEVLYRLHDEVDPALERAMIARVQDCGPTMIGELVGMLTLRGCTLARALTLVARNRLHLDYRRPIDNSAILHADPAAVCAPPLLTAAD